MSQRHLAKKSQPAKPVGPREAVIYTRVSSKEQEEGFSLDAQLGAARAYARDRGLVIIKEFTDIESARKAGRTQFREMVALLKSHKPCPAVIVEKTDRLHRNFPDFGTLDTLMQEKGLFIHYFKEGKVLGKDAKSADMFVHGIIVLQAKNYSDNLSEEVKKGLNEKARQGYWPMRAPVGYVTNADTRHLDLDLEKAPIVRAIFELYATGRRSLADLHAYAKEHDLKAYATKGTISREAIRGFLSNPLYHGVFVFNGLEHDGKHTPIVSKDLFEKVQAIMDGRSGGTYERRTFAYTGLLTCGDCGCAFTAELKKNKYVYYHCTTNRGTCTKKGLTEATVGEQFGQLLKSLQLDERMADTLRVALKESLADETVYHERMVKGLKEQDDKLSARLKQLYVDKLDGEVDPEKYSTYRQQWEKEQSEVRGKLAAHQVADRKYLEFGMQLFELSQTAYSSYLQRSPAEKRELLNFVCSNCKVVDGKLIPTYRQPFALIASAPSMMEERSGPDPSDPTRCQVKWRIADSNSP